MAGVDLVRHSDRPLHGLLHPARPPRAILQRVHARVGPLVSSNARSSTSVWNAPGIGTLCWQTSIPAITDARRIWTFHKSVWWDVPPGISRAERAWLEEKYPGWEETWGGAFLGPDHCPLPERRSGRYGTANHGAIVQYGPSTDSPARRAGAQARLAGPYRIFRLNMRAAYIISAQKWTAGFFSRTRTATKIT